MVRLAATISFLVAIVSSPTWANSFWTSDDLLNQCRSDDAAFIGICAGFAGAMADAIVMYQTALDAPKMVCFPPAGVKLDRIRDIVVRYIEAHPQHGAYAASQQAWLALKEGFPCSR